MLALTIKGTQGQDNPCPTTKRGKDMRKEKVELCKLLCEKFLIRVKEWEEATKPVPCNWGDGERTPSAPKESGALKRASMELTRALADMRKPD